MNVIVCETLYVWLILKAEQEPIVKNETDDRMFLDRATIVTKDLHRIATHCGQYIQNIQL